MERNFICSGGTENTADKCTPLLNRRFEKQIINKDDEIMLGFDGINDIIVFNQTYNSTFKQYLKAVLIDSDGNVLKNFTEKDGEFQIKRGSEGREYVSFKYSAKLSIYKYKNVVRTLVVLNLTSFLCRKYKLV